MTMGELSCAWDRAIPFWPQNDQAITNTKQTRTSSSRQTPHVLCHHDHISIDWLNSMIVEWINNGTADTQDLEQVAGEDYRRVPRYIAHDTAF